MYSLIMRRWGCPDSHAYFLACSQDKALLSFLGKIEESRRGGKYEGSIEKLNFNTSEVYATKLGNEEGMIRVEPFYFEDSRKFKSFSSEDFSIEEMLEAHKYYYLYNTEEQEFLRDWYCSYLKSTT